ncbi:uncharacterized protein HemX [Inquilinus ginsengisoli]|uniref:hypothetical protein n=1 Tax=Inquilinus ginsengisoli TaxID=363840 RepID=UPI003D1AF827
MRDTFKALVAAAALVAGLTAATTVFGQEQKTPTQPPAAHDQAEPGMMQGEGMMGHQGDGMMKMMTQMSEMMENCNKMMQTKAQQSDQGAVPQKQGG